MDGYRPTGDNHRCVSFPKSMFKVGGKKGVASHAHENIVQVVWDVKLCSERGRVCETRRIALNSVKYGRVKGDHRECGVCIGEWWGWGMKWFEGRIGWVIHRGGSGGGAESWYSRSCGSFTAVGELRREGKVRQERVCGRGVGVWEWYFGVRSGVEVM